jgi:hypothetical protein
MGRNWRGPLHLIIGSKLMTYSITWKRQKTKSTVFTFRCQLQRQRNRWKSFRNQLNNPVFTFAEVATRGAFVRIERKPQNAIQKIVPSYFCLSNESLLGFIEVIWPESRVGCAKAKRCPQFSYIQIYGEQNTVGVSYQYQHIRRYFAYLIWLFYIKRDIQTLVRWQSKNIISNSRLEQIRLNSNVMVQ